MSTYAFSRRCRGGTSLLAVFFVSLFAVLAISFTAMSNINVQMSRNHRDVKLAQSAAESGLEFAAYLVGSYVPPTDAYSPNNEVSESEARSTFSYFACHVQNLLYGSPLLGGQGIFWDVNQGVLQVPPSGGVALAGDETAGFCLRFEFVAASGTEPHHLLVTSSGMHAEVSRSVGLTLPIQKENEVLEYAIASRGRMWITGDSIIEGDIFSGWNRTDVSPFNMTSDSRVNGTINTVLTLEEIQNAGAFQLETLDEDGNPLFDENGDRIYGPEDEIQGQHEGINYGVPDVDMPGMDIADYNTDGYMDLVENTIPVSSTQQIEYFPHVAGDYTLPSSYSSRQLNRHVYENQTISNAVLPYDRNALFKNCTFEGVLYIDCYKSATYHYNNVRFDNCTFNGVIVTDTPQDLKWMHNCLYFTGSATFQNNYMEEATILAPHFNVNLGNTNPVEGETNQLTGAVVGGIVDVRGNAEINGTILSMCDTTLWSSGYVTNIGATLGDGGSETTEPGDVGVIHVTPNPNNLLPSGIVTPIVIKMDGNSYVEY
ncbi:MAG: hypothetical protein JW810_05185 [Sedimentisphaerales bacterium]|nr:hypothetical protein [Sedimentisphaerales bacterium]